MPCERYCPDLALLITLGHMRVDKISPRQKSIQKKLADLYSRRAAVESLIRCLESYADCRAKHERSERPNRKSA